MATKKKNVNIIIGKDPTDPRETVFASWQGKALSIPVGVKTSVPEVYYTNVLKDGYLKERVTLLGD